MAKIFKLLLEYFPIDSCGNSRFIAFLDKYCVLGQKTQFVFMYENKSSFVSRHRHNIFNFENHIYFPLSCHLWWYLLNFDDLWWTSHRKQLLIADVLSCSGYQWVVQQTKAASQDKDNFQKSRRTEFPLFPTAEAVTYIWALIFELSETKLSSKTSEWRQPS